MWFEKNNILIVLLAPVIIIFFIYYFSGMKIEIYISYKSLPVNVTSSDELLLNSTIVDMDNFTTTIPPSIVKTNITSSFITTNNLCPVNNKSVIISVKPGGRLGNAVFEYLSVYAWSREIPNSIPVIPNIILSNLRKVYANLTIGSIESLDKKCIQYKFLQRYKQISPKGNWNMKTLENKKRKDPLLMVLTQWTVSSNKIWKYWNDLYKELNFLPALVQKSNQKLYKIRDSFREKFHLQKNENIEFVGVHVRKSDYDRYLKGKYPKAKIAAVTYYTKAMQKMREMLSPKRPIFVVVSDDMAWCKKQLQNIPDVTFSGATGNIGNPSEDISMLCSCNHTIMAYGTFGLTSALCHPNGLVIVYKDTSIMANAAIAFAKYLNWTTLSN